MSRCLCGDLFRSETQRQPDTRAPEIEPLVWHQVDRPDVQDGDVLEGVEVPEIAAEAEMPRHESADAAAEVVAGRIRCLRPGCRGVERDARADVADAGELG